MEDERWNRSEKKNQRTTCEAEKSFSIEPRKREEEKKWILNVRLVRREQAEKK